MGRIDVTEYQFADLGWLCTSFQGELYLLADLLGDLEAIDPLSLNDIEKIILSERFNDLLSSYLKFFLLFEKIFVEVLLNLLFLLLEVALLLLDLLLVKLERRLNFLGRRRVVVDDDSVHVILEDLAGCLGLVGQAVSGVESSQFGVLH